jgi:AcrR family transcriptional regulator
MRLTRAEAVEANREALLASARLQIAADGASVSVEAIAAAADLTTGAIYSIFGSKRDLLTEVLIDDIVRNEAILADLVDPALSLRQVIERYADAWFALAANGAAPQTEFELQVILAATGDERLGRKLAAALDAEIDKLTGLFTGRRVDDSAPQRLTTADEARQIARAVKATITGFALRQTLIPQSRELVRRSCAALAAVPDEA